MSTSKSQSNGKFAAASQDYSAITRTVEGLQQVMHHTLARFVVAADTQNADGLLEETRRLRAVATRLDAYRRLLLREWANEEKAQRENRTTNQAK